MFRTLKVSTLGLAVAAGGPFVYYSAADHLKSLAPPAAATTAATTATTPGATPAVEASVAAEGPNVEGAPRRDLGEVLRLDITPEWVMARWPRVSTGLSQLELLGYRVPLVSGTAEDDLAGSLTYYFTPQQSVQRLTFYGTTGNPQKLVAFLTAQYGFARHVLNDPTLWLYEVPDPDGNAAKSVLRIQSAEIIRADESYRRFQVSLTIERPER
jgi:hypothetical protein